jgi:hypothetical protein
MSSMQPFDTGSLEHKLLELSNKVYLAAKKIPQPNVIWIINNEETNL